MGFKFYKLENMIDEGNGWYRCVPIDPSEWKAVVSFCLNKSDYFKVEFPLYSCDKLGIKSEQFKDGIDEFCNLDNVEVVKTKVVDINNINDDEWKNVFLFCLNNATSIIAFLPIEENMEDKISLFSKCKDINTEVCDCHKQYMEVTAKVTEEVKKLFYQYEKLYGFKNKSRIQLLQGDRQLLAYSHDKCIDVTDEELKYLLDKNIKIKNNNISDNFVIISGKITNEIKEVIYKYEKFFFNKNINITDMCYLYHWKLYKDGVREFLNASYWNRYICITEEEEKTLSNKVDSSNWELEDEKVEYDYIKDMFEYIEYYNQILPSEFMEELPEYLVNAIEEEFKSMKDKNEIIEATPRAIGKAIEKNFKDK